MGPVFSFKWVPIQRGPQPFPLPPFAVFSDEFEAYLTGALNSLPYGASFNTVGTGVWGVVNQTGRRTALFYLVDSYFHDNFEPYSSGTIATIALGSGIGVDFIARGTGYFSLYDSYIFENMEIYPTGLTTSLPSGSGIGGVIPMTGQIIDSGSI